MAFLTKVDNHILKARVHSEVSIPAYDQTNYTPGEHRLVDVMKRVRELHAVVPITVIKWEVQAGDPNVFDLDITTVDGRAWKQTIDISTYGQPKGPGVKFDVREAYWYLPEFGPIQLLRISLIYITANYQVSKITVDFF